jgi:hypothetical protein
MSSSVILYEDGLIFFGTRRHDANGFVSREKLTRNVVG